MLLSWIAGIILIIISITKYFKLGVAPKLSFNYWIVPGPLYIIFPTTFILFVCFSLYLLLKERAQTKDPILRTKINLVLGAQIFGFGGGITNFLPQIFNIYPFGNYFILAYIFFISYSILKYSLFNLKVIATELLIYAIWIFLAARILLANTWSGRLTDGGLFLAMVILGILLIKSVRKEVKQREHIEKLAKDLGVANEKLKELDQMKSEFLSLATHQIRAPLTAIRGYSSMLLEGDFGALPPKALDSVKIITKSSQNLINIVNDFLNISRIEQGRMVYEKSVFDIVEMVKEVADELKPNIKDAGLDLKVNIPDNLFMRVNGDRNKLRQVIGNLLDNATKYTLKGDIEISIMEENNLTAQAGKVKIEIKDTGVGIDPAEIGKLFNKFSRAKDANKTNVIGTGLGLYLAKKMIEAHDGHIQASSEGLGLGTTFTIELPLKK